MRPDHQEFADAVKLLGKARMIHAFGMGGCSTLCSDELQVRLVRFGYPISACHDPVMMRVTAASLDAERVVIACSLTGITPELLEAVEEEGPPSEVLSRPRSERLQAFLSGGLK